MPSKKVLFTSLGCDKNLVDSEKMLDILREQGFELTDDEDEAEILVINTCCFIGDAKEESIQRILELAQLKKTGNAKVLIAAGCLAERYRDEILQELPELDGILGIASWHMIGEVVERALRGEKPAVFLPTGKPDCGRTGRILTTGGHYAYLKIAEGCSKNCSYCVIPHVRGRYVSVPMEQLLTEAEKLAEGGVKELILVAQETTLYGLDLYGRKCLPELLEKLCRIDGFRWIRLMYCYPEEITDELVDVICREEKICHYLDMPVQHASDRILKRMGRRTTRAQITEKIARLREKLPDIVLRTTFMTGFPGETEEDFRELCDFAEEISFERVGVFCYSPEEGTPAADMADQVDEETKAARRDRLMQLQQEISAETESSCVGADFVVMIEGYLPEDDVYVGRTYMDAPGVDSYIFVHTEENLISGDFAWVTVTGSDTYDLVGELSN